MAAETVRTEAKRAIILDSLRNGHTRKMACALAEMSRESLRQWLRDDVDMFAAVKKAEADSSVAILEMLKVHATQTWQTAAWLLERRDPDWRSPETKLREKQGPGHLQIGVSVAPAQAKAIEAEDAEWEPLQLEEPKKTE